MVSGGASILGFQFHKGTIKTQAALLASQKFGHFNSIKVRLKLFV